MYTMDTNDELNSDYYFIDGLYELFFYRVEQHSVIIAMKFSN